MTTVKTFFLDGGKATGELSRLAQRVIGKNPQVQRILLFGSLATGRYVPGSDADLLIVLSADDRPFLDRVPHFLTAFLEAPVPVDVFPYTEKEIERMKSAGNRFISRALSEGIILAARDHPHP